MSSLLGLLSPLRSSDGKGELQLTAEALCRLLLATKAHGLPWANEVVEVESAVKFDAKTLVAELRYRRRLIFAIESYLMANRGISAFAQFKSAAEELATSTVAYHLAPADLKVAIRILFSTVAEYVQQQEPNPGMQAAILEDAARSQKRQVSRAVGRREP